MRPVNLLPESDRRRPPGARPGSSYVVLGVLAALVLLTGVYVFIANQATSRADDAALAAGEADRLEAEAAALGGFGSFAAIKQARVQSVRQLAASRFDWERFVRELARVLPAGTWVQGVDASVTGELDATATATTAVAGPQATITGCAPRQPAVADLMLRLRRMHRVEDVTLGESTREEDGAPATLDSCGRLYQFDVTVSFAAVAVEEAPLGRTQVPAALGGGS